MKNGCLEEALNPILCDNVLCFKIIAGTLVHPRLKEKPASLPCPLGCHVMIEHGYRFT